MAGRPALKEEEKKVSLHTRILPKQKKDLQQKADLYTGGNLSAYIERVLFSDQKNAISIADSSTKLDRESLYSMIREINKMGSNLNQLTKKSHQGSFVGTKIPELLEEIKEVNSNIFDVLIQTLEFKK